MNAFLVDSLLSARSHLINTNTLDNTIYLQKTQIQDTRNELSNLRQIDFSNLFRTGETLGIDLEALDQKYTDSIIRLKNEINMDMNAHTNEHKEVVTNLDLRIQEANHKLVIKLADLKTLIESVKVELTTTIVWLTVGGVGFLMGIDWVFQELINL
jgi:hypothetical protein